MAFCSLDSISNHYFAIRKNTLRASINTFLFGISLLVGCYLYCNYVLGFLPRTYMVIWGVIAIALFFLAYICWYAKGQGAVAIIISSVILGVLFSQTYVYYNQCTPFGIYDENKMVGYFLVIYDYDILEYNIWHMMINRIEQGRGYGKTALQNVLVYICEKPFGDFDRVVLTWNKNKQIALKLNQEFGFSPTRNSDEDEIELDLQLYES